MSEVRHEMDERNEALDTPAGVLVAALMAGDESEHRAARECLVAIGESAIAPLTVALSASDMHTRWEVVSVLADMKDPMAAPALVQALADQAFSVRWLAAEGLIALGREGLAPLLHALVEHGDSFWLRQGAHHVLGALIQEGSVPEVQLVLEALEGVDPQVGVSVAAFAVLNELADDARPTTGEASER